MKGSGWPFRGLRHVWDCLSFCDFTLERQLDDQNSKSLVFPWEPCGRICNYCLLELDVTLGGHLPARGDLSFLLDAWRIPHLPWVFSNAVTYVLLLVILCHFPFGMVLLEIYGFHCYFLSETLSFITVSYTHLTLPTTT